MLTDKRLAEIRARYRNGYVVLNHVADLLAEVDRLRAQPERDSLALELEQTLLVLEEITERGNTMKAELDRLKAVVSALLVAKAEVTP